MTVTYTAEVTTVRPFGNFWRMLFRWRGSIYKLVWQDLLVFLAAFYAVNFTYRLGLSRERRLVFEYVSRIFNDFLSLVPMAFVLGFYVSLVMKRFWDQWWKIPRPDATMVNLVGYFQKDNERSRLMRRTLARYLNLSYVMAMSGVSPRVKRRFPTLQHLVEVGMLEAGELPILTGLGEKYKGNLFWVPIVWCMTIAKKALDEELADSERGYTQTVRCLDEFREGARKVLEYDRISIPLVYTQVVSWATYSYFVAAIVGRQHVQPENDGSDVDLYIPIFTLLEFFFYVGWLKVAETLINPFGDDDDDFELNGLADRHLQTSYLIVDNMFSVTPELQPDLYWTVSVPENLPYTACTAHLRKEPPSPSTAHIASHVSVSSRSLYESIYQSISDDYQTIQPLGTKAPNRSIYQTLRSRSSNLFRSLMRKKAPTALVHAHCETPREERVKGKEPVTGKTPGEDGAASASLNRRNQATSVEERIFFV